jgi:hypothetical protein
VAWFKVDDKLHSSRKLLSIPRRYRLGCLGLWTIAGSWSADQLTDGRVPDYMVEEWGGSKTLIDWLVKADLWQEVSEGTQFKNWGEYQPTKADVEAERDKNREKLRKWRERNQVTKPDVTGLHTGYEPDGNPAPDPTRPDPTRPIKEEADASSRPRKRATRIAEDFQVTPEMKLWASTKAPNADLHLETEKFINFWVAKSGKDATKLDWAATWRNWMLNARGNQPARMDHSARGIAKGTAMLAAWDAQHSQDSFLEIEG